MAGLTVLQAKEKLELTRPNWNDMNLNKLSFAKEMEFAIQAFEKNPFLLSTSGIEKVLTNIVLSGLSLNPILRYAYLVPRKIKNQFVCCVDPSYMGLCKILTDTGSVVGISATIVYEKEIASLDIKEGMGGYAKHKPYFGFDNPGKPMACYSIGILPNGMQHVELLRPFEWEAIELRSESVKSFNTKKAAGEYAAIPTWQTDKSEMIRKTCLKKHFKYLPKTERAIQAAAAIEMDNQTNGIDFENEAKLAITAVSAATPEAPAASDMATQEDYDKILELLNSGEMGNPFLAPGYEKTQLSVVIKRMEEHAANGTLLKVDADKNYGWFMWEKIETEKLKAQKAATETQEAQ